MTTPEPAQHQTQRIQLNVNGLTPAEMTEFREIRGGTFLDPAQRLRELRPNLYVPGKTPEGFALAPCSMTRDVDSLDGSHSLACPRLS